MPTPVVNVTSTVQAYGSPGIKGESNTYYYGTDPENITKLERKQFIQVMSEVMKSKPEILAKIKDKSFRYGDIEYLAECYQTDKIPELPPVAKDDIYGH